MSEETVSADAVYSALSMLQGVKPYQGRGDMDRYRDYRAVLLNSEQGRRVLADILRNTAMSKAIPPAGSPVDPYRSMELCGRRNVGLSIIGALTHEPPAQPTQANRGD